MNQPKEETQADRKWTELWNLFYAVDDRHWPAQKPTLKAISRVALELVASIEEGE